MAERLINIVRGFGSIFEIWPTPPKLEEVSPHDATELVRQSWESAGEALWSAIGVIGVETEGTEAAPTGIEEDPPQGGPSDA